MILNKKGFMMLPLAALLFATGCAKNLTYKEAVQFVEDNYSQDIAKKPTSAYVEIKGINADTEAERSIVEALALTYEMTYDIKIEFNDNCYAKAALPADKMEEHPITVDDIYEQAVGADAQVTYSAKGKSFYQTAHGKTGDKDTLSVEVWSEMNCNDTGHKTKNYLKTYMKGKMPVTEELSFDVDFGFETTETFTF